MTTYHPKAATYLTNASKVFACVLLAGAAVLPAATRAQTKGPAQVLLQESLTAYGAWASVSTLQYHSEGQRFDPWQSFSPYKATAVPISADRGADVPRRKLWADLHSQFAGGYHFHFFLAANDSVFYVYDADGTRQGRGVSQQGAAAVTANLEGLAQDLPYFAVRALASSTDSLVLAPPVERAGRRHQVVHRFSKGKPQPTRYFFDDASKRLASVATALDLPTGSAQDERFYDDYRQQPDGLWTATRTRQLRNGQLFARETISRLRTNQPFEEQKLRLPAGYRLAGPPTPSKVSQLAPDIYLLDHVGGGRNVLFVNLDSSILVMDPPLASAVAKQVLDHIHRTLPGKPVRYVFATHFHADHSLGMPEMLKQGAALIATKPTSDKVLQLPRPLSSGAQAPAQPPVAIKGKLVWGDAHHVIEFHEIPNSHVEGMAFAYFPKEKLLYQGDLLTLPEEGIMGPALPVTRELARYLKQKRMAFVRMIGHHGSNAITPDLFEQQLAR